MTEADPPAEAARIRPLDDATIQQIAAGEVVERPASVVKELLENSLDAGASRISVAVEAGGTAGIRVADDGHGIPADDLPLAVAEHATSKLRDTAELDRGVESLGFRGEALATIGAVSRLTVRSRVAGASAGAELTVEAGDVGTVRPAGCPEGTVVEVDELFANTPARKKFLKREATEFDHVNTVVSQYALANPAVAISLEHDGREVFGTEGGGSLRAAVLSVYGREVAESMCELTYDGDGAGGADDVDRVDGAGGAGGVDRVDGAGDAGGVDRVDGAGDAGGVGRVEGVAADQRADEPAPVDSISGLVSHPETTRSTRAYLSTFVNGRYVTDAALRGAVIEGYGGQLAPDRYPFAVVFLEVPPASVDVNVHPRKTDVRFDDEAAVVGAVREAVERSLIDAGLIRSAAPRGRSAPDETPISPQRADGEVVGGAGTDHDADRNTGRTAAGGTDRSTPDAVDGAGTTPADSVADAGADDVDTEPTDHDPTTTDVDAGADDAGPTRPDADTNPVEAADPDAPDGWALDGLSGPDRSPTTHAGATGPAALDGTSASTSAGERPWARSRPTAEPTQRTLAGGETTDRRAYDQLPSMRVLGQLYETYLLAATDSGLLLIDQHAADERVNYERLQEAFASSPAAQTLAEPVSLELTAREAALFADHADALADLGFRAERRGDAGRVGRVGSGDADTDDRVDGDGAADDRVDGDDGPADREVVVTAVPAVLGTTLDPGLLREALLRFVDAADGGDPVAAAADELLADLACYPSVTGNTALTEGSAVGLLSALDDCANPYACPHGRPVFIEISREEIGERFERDYPGHAGRREP